MKKNRFFLLMIILVTACTFGGCKKESTETPPPSTPQVETDYTPLFKNTIWSGEFNYSGKGQEPMSIEFADDGYLVWRELSGNYTGTWQVNKKQLYINFDNIRSFTADISADSSLTNLQSADASGRELKNAALSKGSIPDLDNTTWVASNVSIAFKPGSVLDLYFGMPTAIPPSYTDINYTRVGRSIHFTLTAGYNWFTIIKSTSVMKGTNHAPSDPTVYAFEVVRQ